MSEENEQISQSTGYLLIQSQQAYVQHAHDHETILEELLEPAEPISSFANQGWYLVTSIKDGDVIKISATHHGINIEANFKSAGPTVRGGSCGDYEVRGGLFGGRGKFKNVAIKLREDADFRARDNTAHAHFFVCHSEGAINNVPFLRWRIALREFSENKNAIE